MRCRTSSSTRRPRTRCCATTASIWARATTSAASPLPRRPPAEVTVQAGEAPRRLGLVVATRDEAEHLLAKMPELVQRSGRGNARADVERGGVADVVQRLGEVEPGFGERVCA